MPQPRVLTPQDYLGMLRRRWYLAVFPAIAGLIIGYGLVRILPKRYTSQSLMLVEQQQVPPDYIEGVFAQPVERFNADDLNLRIAHLEEETLSRARLEPVIERYSAFRSEAAHEAMDSLVREIQKLVDITPVQPVIKTENKTIPGFYLSVTLPDPTLAQEVCADIASMFVEEDIRERERSAQGTTSFLQSQLADAKHNLDEQDAKLAVFESRYMGMLPDETATNLSMLRTLNTQLDTANQALNRAQQSKAYTQTVLAQQVQAWKLTQEMQHGYIPTQSADPLDRRLAHLQAELATLQARYTPDYPDLISTKAEIARLKQQIGSKKQIGGTDKSPQGAPGVAREPTEIQQLRGQVRADDETITLAIHEQQQLKRTIKVYESRLQLSPGVEEQYKKITRDHETALKFYASLLKKRDQSQMASELQRRQQGEQLSVLDPASLPDKASFPKPLLFIGGGFAAGLVLGLAAILGIEISDKRLRTERDLQYYLGTSAFALIPCIEIAAVRRLPKAST